MEFTIGLLNKLHVRVIVEFIKTSINVIQPILRGETQLSVSRDFFWSAGIVWMNVSS